jgi:hypothetical protein
MKVKIASTAKPHARRIEASAQRRRLEKSIAWLRPGAPAEALPTAEYTREPRRGAKRSVIREFVAGDAMRARLTVLNSSH